MPLKLGSNWKSVGIGEDMRRWAHGNSRINFGFCKGDDNFGGRKRKELDDFLKSLGKQMTLTLYRMEDTERVRFQLRENRRREVRERAEKEEEIEKAKDERLERNRKWREKRFGSEKLSLSVEEDRELTEQELRRLKNKEWRERRESGSTSGQSVKSYSVKDEDPGLPSLEHLILRELLCPFCQDEMGPPTEIYQCSEGHNLCHTCRHRQDMKECPQCQAEITGRNIAVERMAASLWSVCSLGPGEARGGAMQEYVSKSFIYRSSGDIQEEEEDRIRGRLDHSQGDTSENVSEIDSLLLMTEGETLRIK